MKLTIFFTFLTTVCCVVASAIRESAPNNGGYLDNIRNRFGSGLGYLKSSSMSLITSGVGSTRVQTKGLSNTTPEVGEPVENEEGEKENASAKTGPGIVDKFRSYLPRTNSKDENGLEESSPKESSAGPTMMERMKSYMPRSNSKKQMEGAENDLEESHKENTASEPSIVDKIKLIKGINSKNNLETEHDDLSKQSTGPGIMERIKGYVPTYNGNKQVKGVDNLEESLKDNTAATGTGIIDKIKNYLPGTNSKTDLPTERDESSTKENAAPSVLERIKSYVPRTNSKNNLEIDDHDEEGVHKKSTGPSVMEKIQGYLPMKYFYNKKGENSESPKQHENISEETTNENNLMKPTEERQRSSDENSSSSENHKGIRIQTKSLSESETIDKSVNDEDEGEDGKKTEASPKETASNPGIMSRFMNFLPSREANKHTQKNIELSQNGPEEIAAHTENEPGFLNKIKSYIPVVNYSKKPDNHLKQTGEHDERERNTDASMLEAEAVKSLPIETKGVSEGNHDENAEAKDDDSKEHNVVNADGISELIKDGDVKTVPISVVFARLQSLIVSELENSKKTAVDLMERLLQGIKEDRRFIWIKDEGTNYIADLKTTVIEAKNKSLGDFSVSLTDMFKNYVSKVQELFDVYVNKLTHKPEKKPAYSSVDVVSKDEHENDDVSKDEYESDEAAKDEHDSDEVANDEHEKPEHAIHSVENEENMSGMDEMLREIENAEKQIQEIESIPMYKSADIEEAEKLIQDFHKEASLVRNALIRNSANTRMRRNLFVR